MGTSAAHATAAAPDPAHTTTVVKQGSGKSDAPDSRGGARKGTLERNGFKGAPQVNYVYPNNEESGQTFRNVRILPASRGSQSFYDARRETSQDVF